MDTNDRETIGGLFEKLAEVAHQAPDRDAEAERFIGEAIWRQPRTLPNGAVPIAATR